MDENQAKTELLTAAAKLHKAAGEEWNNFINALRELGPATADTLVRSPAERLPFAQGRAQHAREIITLLEKA